jgi:hypothetical protein
MNKFERQNMATAAGNKNESNRVPTIAEEELNLEDEETIQHQ